MRTLLAVLSVCTAMGFAAPAYADPADISGDDAGFLSALQKVGIHYPSPDQAITAGKSVCACLNGGESGLEYANVGGASTTTVQVMPELIRTPSGTRSAAPAGPTRKSD